MSALCQKQTFRVLFDHLVGGSKQGRRYRQAKCLRSLEIYHQLELGRLCDWQLLGLGALEDFTRVNGGLTISINKLPP